MAAWAQQYLMQFIDLIYAYLPQLVPSQIALQSCKIISHRGEHDNITVLENTLPAFDLARDNGVWGIECDIRWTRDLVPVISHDPDGQRIFKDPVRISSLTAAELRARLPQIPTLAELVQYYGGNTHLMIEVKDEPYPQPDQQKQALQSILAPLAPGKDYHFLALDPELFEKVDFLPPEYHFTVAELNVRKLSQHALTQGLGGLTGHYLLLNNDLKSRHEAVGQRIGTGFIASKYCLFRELNRGIEWIFSNHAVKIQKIRDQYLR